MQELTPRKPDNEGNEYRTDDKQPNHEVGLLEFSQRGRIEAADLMRVVAPLENFVIHESGGLRMNRRVDGCVLLGVAAFLVSGCGGGGVTRTVSCGGTGSILEQ